MNMSRTRLPTTISTARLYVLIPEVIKNNVENLQEYSIRYINPFHAA